jgi:Rad3-related DNA helicase
VIRHINDYGTIYLFDERYSYSNNKNGISLWLRNKMRNFEKFDQILTIQKHFFADMTERNFKPKVAMTN